MLVGLQREAPSVVIQVRKIERANLESASDRVQNSTVMEQSEIVRFPIDDVHELKVRENRVSATE